MVPDRRPQDDAARLGRRRLPAVGLFLNGEEIPTRTPTGDQVIDESFLLLFNAHHEPATSCCRRGGSASGWLLELSTAEPEAGRRAHYAARARAEVEARSMVVLRRN